MITITITGDDTKIANALPLYAKSVGWADDQVDGEGNPVTVLEAAKTGLQNHIRSQIQSQGVREAKQAAITQAIQSVDAGLDGVAIEVSES